MTTVLNVPGNSAGAMNGDGSRKALLHSTEGSKWEGAVAAYTANNSWPHRTVDGPRRIVVRHLPLDVAGRALRNEAGGVETNREGSILIQYELVGFASIPGLGWSDEDWEWFGAEVLGPDCRATGVPVSTGVAWVAYPASYGKGAPQRLSGSAWDAYEGVLGHEHAPENSHGDPGAIPIQAVLAAAHGRPLPPEDDMPTVDELLTGMAKALGTPGHPLRHAFGEVVDGQLQLDRDAVAQAVVDRWADDVATPGRDARKALGEVVGGQVRVLRPFLAWAAAGSPVYVVDGQRSTARLIDGWDAVAAEVDAGVVANGTMTWHGNTVPKPYTVPAEVLERLTGAEPVEG